MPSIDRPVTRARRRARAVGVCAVGRNGRRQPADGNRQTAVPGSRYPVSGVRSPESAVRTDSDEVLEATLATLERYAPGLRALVVQAEVITPSDLERGWGLTGGHIFHGELSLDQAFTMRPLLGWGRYQTPINGLYLCGSGTHPGTGLTGGSGLNAARVIVDALT